MSTDTKHPVGAAPTMNDYYEVRFRLTPADADAADYLASDLGEIGFETFEQSSDGSEMTAYVPAPIYDAEALAQAVADNPFDVTMEYSAEFVPGRDWNEEWEKHYFQPIVVGGEVLVHSSFHTDLPTARYDIVIDPRMAFGTGHHATTTLMMEYILSHDMQGLKVLDMGTGTAILAILACMRGAADVLGIEIDPAAVDNAIDNVKLNLGDSSCLRILHGDASAIPAGTQVDYFLANINRNVITADIDAYAAALRPGGRLCVSGFYVEDRPIVIAAAKKAGFSCEDMKEKDTWSSIWFFKNA
ncbi:MAG: 50S ribosomal protein L11 methyltransferase [Muribaculaceae bacterium]|nr:50S ribosomal protein L11 methyltransferase [Muribaculaceae bacterium]